MRKDPHIRSYSEAPPFMPGTDTRFRWPDEWSEEVQMLRERMPKGGEGLYILKAPYGNHSTLLVEAYYPDQIRSHRYEWYDPFRREDYRQGKLVVEKVHSKIKAPETNLHMGHVRELRRNARAHRSDLKRESTGVARKQAMRRHRQKKEQPIFDRWQRFYDHAIEETRKFALKTRVGPAGGNRVDPTKKGADLEFNVNPLAF